MISAFYVSVFDGVLFLHSYFYFALFGCCLCYFFLFLFPPSGKILSKMDGLVNLENVLVVGMTNRKELLDEALLRPGRMEVRRVLLLFVEE